VKQRLTDFINALRDAGLSITLASSLDAMRAVAVVGIERAPLREGLAATLVKDEADRPTFDRVFDRFFAAPGRQRGRGARPQPSGDGAGGGLATSGTRSATWRPPDSRGPKPRGRPVDDETRRRQRITAGDHLQRQRTLRSLPFADMSADDVDACELLAAELARHLRLHLKRRLQAWRRGRLDVRRTLRASISTGGVPITPRFRQRPPDRPRLVALCDLSYSVATATHFLLRLLAPSTAFFRRASLFAFVDHPVEMSIEDGQVVPHQPLDLYARSDCGQVLKDFVDAWAGLLTRKTIVLVMGDARNNRRPARADILEQIHRRVGHVVWLNPEAVHRWNTGDSAMRAYEKHCDAVLAASNLDELERALRRAFRGP